LAAFIYIFFLYPIFLLPRVDKEQKAENHNQPNTLKPLKLAAKFVLFKLKATLIKKKKLIERSRKERSIRRKPPFYEALAKMLEAVFELLSVSII
jgi:hypothetical protein